MRIIDTLPVRGSLRYVIGISLVAALGGFLFGFDMIVVSGTIKSITALFALEGLRLGWATSCCVFACIPGGGWQESWPMPWAARRC